MRLSDCSSPCQWVSCDGSATGPTCCFCPKGASFVPHTATAYTMQLHGTPLSSTWKWGLLLLAGAAVVYHYGTR